MPITLNSVHQYGPAVYINLSTCNHKQYLNYRSGRRHIKPTGAPGYCAVHTECIMSGTLFIFDVKEMEPSLSQNRNMRKADIILYCLSKEP